MSALSIVFQNPRVVVIDKPAGWLSVPSRLGHDDARPCAGPALQQQLGVRLWPAHRLDLEVSGLLLFAKDADAHRVLGAAFEQRSIRKTYSAVTQGPVPGALPFGETVRWESRLLRGKKRAYEHPQGKESVTLATLVRAEPGAPGRLFWELRPLTGRPHQLRVELARHGCPIAGDTLYGASLPWPDGIALRAVALDLTGVKEAQALGLPPTLQAAPLVLPGA